ncbi:hypothetical protein BGZ60DRAFT_27920 [Tricladium varicosporioides]|nr:hypothetical protein BGZ60DRAFT_27920 [Hymenoscyphus varicosporioides]
MQIAALAGTQPAMYPPVDNSARYKLASKAHINRALITSAHMVIVGIMVGIDGTHGSLHAGCLPYSYPCTILLYTTSVVYVINTDELVLLWSLLKVSITVTQSGNIFMLSLNLELFWVHGVIHSFGNCLVQL